MKREVLNIRDQGKDFIIDDNGLRIYHDDEQGNFHRVFIRRSVLIELYDSIPIDKLRELEKEDELPF